MSFVSYQNLEINKLEICENSFIQKSDFFKKSAFYTDQHFHKFQFSILRAVKFLNFRPTSSPYKNPKI